jgi:hypothetical protein
MIYFIFNNLDLFDEEVMIFNESDLLSLEVNNNPRFLKGIDDVWIGGSKIAGDEEAHGRMNQKNEWFQRDLFETSEFEIDGKKYEKAKINLDKYISSILDGKKLY